METRKLAGQMAALCPFALVFGMGFTARKVSEPHHTLQYSEAQDRRLEAYLPLMAGDSPMFLSPDKVRSEAKAWCNASDARRLQPLTPAFQEEELMDTPRSAVLERWSSMILGLAKVSRHELSSGNVNLAAEDTIRLIKVCEILKYSDFNSVRIATSTESRLVTLVRANSTSLPESTRKALNVEIRRSLGNRGRLNEMYAILKANYESYLYRSSAAAELSIAADSEFDPTAPSQERLDRYLAWAHRDESKLVEQENLLLKI